ncbi:RNA polymerase sigma-70 factor (ECF subfamily) [Saccharomonospora amisosensis]|uniref:RNA polymerase sigma-70 factor (ECF subfamily) n=1 Tax=Saccharomonospora amisosensis TaxID=1128677 RepID=A0A7X5USX0_9PSEU|nr:RNA polymerase sigma factor SigJ [Saccharomonospora amisosensis]NIJ13093.1 RNA polymerase sigma-70 factor (ECF subfamily) [Saccharomonospora amisosensis]
MSLETLASEFAGHRSHLIAVAYRLTGSLADAEDAAQEAWLRLSGLSREKSEQIQDLRAWLTTVVGRLCLDRLRSATARRERYVGEWLPEPIVTDLDASIGEDPLDAVVRDDGVRMAAMVLLDRLTPQQRVAFVLHDAFKVSFAEIGEILGCTPQAARQHASRGRRALADAEPPPRASLQEQREVLERFTAAVLSGDLHAVARVLHPDIVLIGDSDGKGRTTRRTMVGADKFLRFFAGLRRMYPPDAFAATRPVLVNGDLGMYLPAQPGGEHYRDVDEHVQAMTVHDGRIVAVYDIVNPDKLRHLPASVTRAGG